jgi:hypothetical protein
MTTKKKRTVTIRRSRGEASFLATSRLAQFPSLLTVGVLMFLLCLSRGAAGQEDKPAPKKAAEKPYALLFGTVWGPDNQPLYGVKVKIRRADQKKAKWELMSDHHGEFAQRLPSGTADYVIWADLKAYKSLTGKELKEGGEVKVHIDNDERADIGLHLK